MGSCHARGEYCNNLISRAQLICISVKVLLVIPVHARWTEQSATGIMSKPHIMSVIRLVLGHKFLPSVDVSLEATNINTTSPFTTIVNLETQY